MAWTLMMQLVVSHSDCLEGDLTLLLDRTSRNKLNMKKKHNYMNIFAVLQNAQTCRHSAVTCVRERWWVKRMAWVHGNRKLSKYIYNGNICPSLNPAKIFQFISRWIESTKSSAVGPNHRAVINTSNEVKSPLLWEFWIYNFSLRILERVLGWKHCKYKEWVSFFWVHGEWIVARNKQIGREPLRGSRDLFVPRYDSFPMNPEKKTLIPKMTPNVHPYAIRCLLG